MTRLESIEAALRREFSGFRAYRKMALTLRALEELDEGEKATTKQLRDIGSSDAALDNLEKKTGLIRVFRNRGKFVWSERLQKMCFEQEDIDKVFSLELNSLFQHAEEDNRVRDIITTKLNVALSSPDDEIINAFFGLNNAEKANTYSRIIREMNARGIVSATYDHKEATYHSVAKRHRLSDKGQQFLAMTY